MPTTAALIPRSADQKRGSDRTRSQNGSTPIIPPILTILKKDGKNHPLEMQERFSASYRKRGGPIQMQMFDGLPEHRWPDAAELPEAMRAIDTIVEFVQRRGLSIDNS